MTCIQRPFDPQPQWVMEKRAVVGGALAALVPVLSIAMAPWISSRQKWIRVACAIEVAGLTAFYDGLRKESDREVLFRAEAHIVRCQHAHLLPSSTLVWNKVDRVVHDRYRLHLALARCRLEKQRQPSNHPNQLLRTHATAVRSFLSGKEECFEKECRILNDLFIQWSESDLCLEYGTFAFDQLWNDLGLQDYFFGLPKEAKKNLQFLYEGFKARGDTNNKCGKIEEGCSFDKLLAMYQGAGKKEKPHFHCLMYRHVGQLMLRMPHSTLALMKIYTHITQEEICEGMQSEIKNALGIDCINTGCKKIIELEVKLEQAENVDELIEVFCKYKETLNYLRSNKKKVVLDQVYSSKGIIRRRLMDYKIYLNNSSVDFEESWMLLDKYREVFPSEEKFIEEVSGKLKALESFLLKGDWVSGGAVTFLGMKYSPFVLSEINQSGSHQQKNNAEKLYKKVCEEVEKANDKLCNIDSWNELEGWTNAWKENLQMAMRHFPLRKTIKPILALHCDLSTMQKAVGKGEKFQIEALVSLDPTTISHKLIKKTFCLLLGDQRSQVCNFLKNYDVSPLGKTYSENEWNGVQELLGEELVQAFKEVDKQARNVFEEAGNQESLPKFQDLEKILFGLLALVPKAAGKWRGKMATLLGLSPEEASKDCIANQMKKFIEKYTNEFTNPKTREATAESVKLFFNKIRDLDEGLRQYKGLRQLSFLYIISMFNKESNVVDPIGHCPISLEPFAAKENISKDKKANLAPVVLNCQDKNKKVAFHRVNKLSVQQLVGYLCPQCRGDFNSRKPRFFEDPLTEILAEEFVKLGCGFSEED